MLEINEQLYKMKKRIDKYAYILFDTNIFPFKVNILYMYIVMCSSFVMHRYQTINGDI